MIAERIYQHARAQPLRRAIVWNGLPVSYLQFAQAIQKARTSWHAEDLPADSVAVVIVHSLLECWPCVLALQSLGLRTVCAVSLQAARALGLRNVSCFVLCQNKEQAQGCREELVHWRGLRRLSQPANLYTPAPESPLPQLASDTRTGGHILCSSGTTGNYKKLFHDGARDEVRCARRAAADGAGADSVSHTVNFGLWTAAGYRRPLVSWHAGGCAVFDQRASWPLHLGEHGVTHLLLVPAMLSEAIEVLRSAQTRPNRGSFELVVGGAPLSAAVLPAVFEYLTPNLSITFGSTELWLSALRSPVRDAEDLRWISPWQGRELQIVTESDQPCADGVEGVLRVRITPLDYSNYLDDSDTTARMFRDGWFYPGDLAVRRADGRIRILGRSADVINVGGSKYATGPLEESLREALGVSTVCLFSDPAATGRNLLVVVLETPEQPPQARLDAVVPLLPDTGRPTICFCKVAEFPRTGNGTGKVDRRALRQRIAQINFPA